MEKRWIGGYKVGTVVWIEKFTYYENKNAFDRRPAVIIKNDKDKNTVTCVKISSSSHYNKNMAYRVKDLEKSGLTQESNVICNNLIRIPKNIKVFERGEMAEEELFNIKALMKTLEEQRVIEKVFYNEKADIDCTHRHTENVAKDKYKNIRKGARANKRKGVKNTNERKNENR